jgi:hypothetical protein
VDGRTTETLDDCHHFCYLRPHGLCGEPGGLAARGQGACQLKRVTQSASVMRASERT